MKVFRVLTNKGECGYVKVDDADACLLRSYTWRLIHKKTSWTLARETLTGTVTFGRFLLGMHDPKKLVAHKNSDQLDFRRTNLQIMLMRDYRRFLVKLAGTRVATAHAGLFKCGHPKAPDNRTSRGFCRVCSLASADRTRQRAKTKRVRTASVMSEDA